MIKWANTGFQLEGGHLSCYKNFIEKVNWHDAETQCQIEGGHPASIGSTEESHSISQFVMDEDTWIGANYINDGVWKWTDGSTWTLSNWHPNEPKCDHKTSGGHWTLIKQYQDMG